MYVAAPVRSWLRLEGFAMLVGGLTVWAALDGSWLWFALLFLAPDLSMLGYLAGSRVGAAAYNAVHSYIVPVLLLIVGGMLDHRLMLFVSALWIAHIGFDRMVGYGLKYPTGFRDTHLGLIGRGRESAAKRLHTDEFMAIQFEKYRKEVSEERNR